MAWLFRSSQGLILISFGTMIAVDVMPVAYVRAIVEAARRLPNYTFFWQVTTFKINIPIVC